MDFVAKEALDLESPQYCMMNLEKLVVVSGPGSLTGRILESPKVQESQDF